MVQRLKHLQCLLAVHESNIIPHDGFKVCIKQHYKNNCGIVAYFSNAWCWLDFVIVGVSIVNFVAGILGNIT